MDRREIHTSDQAGFRASGYPPELIGHIARTISDLKPAGYIEVEGKNYAALSQMSYIDKGSLVRIIGGQGAYFIVTEETKKNGSNRN